MAEDPWFTCYHGAGFRVVPRNAKGWISFALVMVLVLVPVGLLPWMLPRAPWLMPVLFGGSAVVMIAFITFAIRNSEKIDMRELARDMADFCKWREEQKRRR